MKNRHSLLTAPRHRSARAAAMIETAIMLPLYMIILFGLLYFGYATLSKQAQTSCAQYAAWCPQMPSAKTMLEERFWPWAGDATQLDSSSGRSEAEATDMNLVIKKDTHTGDPYYGEEIQTQLADGKGSLIGGDNNNVFHLERLTVNLWTYALGEINQRFVWTEDGVEEEMNIHYDDMANFLSTSAQQSQSPERQIGFIDTPVSADSDVPPVVSDHEPRIATAINGPGEHWLERRLVTVESTYRPPFFKNIYSEQDAPPTDYATYISLQYEEPDDETLTTAYISGKNGRQPMRFDVTGRGSGERNAAGENGELPTDVLTATANLLGADQLPMDDGSTSIGDKLGPSLRTVKDCWARKTSDF